MTTKNAQYAHYTNFGMSAAPSCADKEGFLKFRSGYERAVARDQWTDAENLIWDIGHPEEFCDPND